MGWYKGVIEQGYSFDGNYAQQQNVAFTPAYPLLCRAVRNMFGIDTPLAMHIISSLFFFITLAVLYALLAKLFSKEFALATTLVYATNPFTLFQLYGYGDVIFITGVALFFYFLEIKQNFLLTALCVSLASISRPYGILLVAPLLVGIAAKTSTLRNIGREYRRTIHSWLACAPIATAGFLLYSFWSQLQFGDPLVFLHIHDAWNVPCGTLTWVARLRMTNLIASMQPVFSQDLLNPPGLAALFVVAVSVLSILTASYKRLPLSMNIYWMLLTGFLLLSSTGCHPNLIALGRHSLGILPLFVLFMMMLASLCGFPLGNKDDRPPSHNQTYRLLAAAGTVAVVNVIILGNYIHRFFLFQWVG